MASCNMRAISVNESSLEPPSNGTAVFYSYMSSTDKVNANPMYVFDNLMYTLQSKDASYLSLMYRVSAYSFFVCTVIYEWTSIRAYLRCLVIDVNTRRLQKKDVTFLQLAVLPVL